MTHRREINRKTTAIMCYTMYYEYSMIAHAISRSIMFDGRFELIRKIRLSNEYFKFISLTSVECWLVYALILKSFHSNIVFNDHECNYVKGKTGGCSYFFIN